MPGIPIGWVSIDKGDPAVGRELGSIEAFTSNAVKIIAVVRDDEVHAAVPPDFTIRAGDQLVAVGAPDRIASAFRAATTRGAKSAHASESDA
jgi:K+/H+ antiporter YhaU regulatory subunit KhtT